MRNMEKIASAYAISNEAKNSSTNELLSNELYADDFNRLYPFHTKEACERSMAEYLYDNGDVKHGDRVADRLSKAASLYSLEWPKKKANSSTMVKVSSRCPDTGEILEVEFYNTPEGVKHASEAVLEFRKKASYAPCMELAQGVVKHAFEHNCDIPDGIMKLAGYCLGTKEAVLSAINKRANRVGNSIFDKCLNTMMDNIHNTPGDIVPQEELVKIASVLDAFDGLRDDRGYTTYNIPPEQEIFDKSAFELVTELEDEVYIPSVDAVVSNRDLHKNASEIIQVMEDMGLSADKSNLTEVVTGLNSKQASYLFGELE
jgi:hypothetical protein